MILRQNNVLMPIVAGYLRAKRDSENKRKEAANNRLLMYYENWNAILETE